MFSNEEGANRLEQAVGSDALAPTSNNFVAEVAPTLEEVEAPTVSYDQGRLIGDLVDLVSVEARLNASPTDPSERQSDGAVDGSESVTMDQPDPKGCRLIVVAGPDVGRSWVFWQTQIRIGRDETCTLVLADLSVSRHHAQIYLEEGGYFIEDEGSNNGTLLNDHKLTGRTALTSGDELTLGDRVVRFLEVTPETADENPSKVIVIPREGNESWLGWGYDTLKIGLKVFALVGLIGFLTWVLTLFVAHERTIPPKDLARLRFLQSVVLIKAKRFGDAQLVLDELERLEPNHPQVKVYQRHVVNELRHWAELRSARTYVTRGQLEKALQALKYLPLQSAYAEEADRLRHTILTNASNDSQPPLN